SDADCDDNDVCTLDACESNGRCSHSNIAGCCNRDADCNDQNTCTQDLCVFHMCRNDAIAGCCNTDPQCDDSNACTVDRCGPPSGVTGGPVLLMGIDAEDGGPGGRGAISIYENTITTGLLANAAGGDGILVFGGGKTPGDFATSFWTT